MIKIPNTWENNKTSIEKDHWDKFYDLIYLELIEILISHKRSIKKLLFQNKEEIYKLVSKNIFKLRLMQEVDNIDGIVKGLNSKKNSESKIGILRKLDNLKKGSTFFFLIIGNKPTLTIFKNIIGERSPDKQKNYTSSDTIDSLFIDIKDLFIKKYEAFRSDWKDWNGYELTKRLGIITCPYCNRSYISSYVYNKNNEDKSKTTAQLDHYFSKTKYPYLIFSLYNLIPCCPTCNHNKLDNEEGLYPYDEDFSSYNIKFKIDDINLLDSNPENINIEISDSNGGTLPSNIENSIKAFHLDKIYENHKLEVNDIRLKWKCYSNEYLLNEIEGIIQTFDSTIDRNKMLDLLYSNFLDKNDHHKKTLSKFTSDIIDYFELDRKK